jgi:VanZ family protein
VLINNLPASLWSFTLTMYFQLIYKSFEGKWFLKIYLIPILIGILTEFFQLIGTLPGTFDSMDILFYIIGGILAIILIISANKLDYNKKINL